MQLLRIKSVIFLCFVVCYFISVLVLESSSRGRGSWMSRDSCVALARSVMGLSAVCDCGIS